MCFYFFLPGLSFNSRVGRAKENASGENDFDLSTSSYLSGMRPSEFPGAWDAEIA